MQPNLTFVLNLTPALELQEGLGLADVYPNYWNPDKPLPWVATRPNGGP